MVKPPPPREAKTIKILRFMIDCCDKCATYDGGIMHPPIGCHNNNCDCHLQKASNHMQTEQEKLTEEQKAMGRKWFVFFEKETQEWYNSLLDNDKCVVCGCDPKAILMASKLISVEIKEALTSQKQKIREMVNELDNPYPVDVFPSETGRACNMAYEACLSDIKQRMEDL